MPDNVTAPAAGVPFATDEVGGVHFPYAKLAFGADNSAVPVADATNARLPVKLAEALPAGTATIGAVELATASLTTIGATNAAAAADETANTGLNGLLKGIFAVLRVRLPALVGGLLPVSVPRFAWSTRAYDFAAGQRLTTAGAGQVRSGAVAATEVLLHAQVRGFFRVGDGTVSASVGAGSIPLEAGEKFHLQITSGQFISWIRDGATDGSLTIVPVAA